MGTVEIPQSDKNPFLQMISGLLAEETGKALQYLGTKLEKGIFSGMKTKSSIKEKLHDCLSRNFQAIHTRCLETCEVTGDNARYSPREIAEILTTFGGSGFFNAGNIEKPPSQKPLTGNLELFTNKILRQKNDASLFLPDGRSSCLVVCSFKDNALKPKTVTDVKLCINIPDSDLVSVEFRSFAIAKYLIKTLLSNHLTGIIDREIEKQQEQDNFSIDAFAEAITGWNADFDMASVREHICNNGDIDSVRSLGFAGAAHILASLLGSANMSFQFIENHANEVIIREYEDTDTANLPDEHFSVKLILLDAGRLHEERENYHAQVRDFEYKVRHLRNLIEVIYQDSKSIFKVNDFEDLARKNRSRIQLLKDTTGANFRSAAGEWGDLSTKESIRACLARMHERINNMYEFLYPVERRVMEERLFALESEYTRIERLMDPSRLQPGLVLDMDMTTIKQKKTTVQSMAQVLKDFLLLTSPG